MMGYGGWGRSGIDEMRVDMEQFRQRMTALSLASSAGVISTGEIRTEWANLNENLNETRSTLARCGGCGATETIGSRCNWCRQVVTDNERRK